MNESLDPTKENLNPEEVEIDKALRPLNFSDFNGQNSVIDNLKIFVEAANQRSDALTTWFRQNNFSSHFSE